MLFAAAIFVIGERRNLFASKNEYSILLDSVSGLDKGSNVHLDGVNVGSIAEIVLAEDVRESKIEVRVRVDSRYGGRGDTRFTAAQTTDQVLQLSGPGAVVLGSSNSDCY